MRQSPSLVRPQTGQGFDLLLGARLPRVLEFCPSVGLLLSYMEFARSKASLSTKNRCAQSGIRKQRFFGVYRYLTNLGHDQNILMFPPSHCPFRGTPSRVRQILLAKLSGSSQLLHYFQKFLARLKAKLVTNFSFPP